MANPQIENGHLKIANEVWDKLMASCLAGSEFQLVLAVIRCTWGWKRKEWGISVPEFHKITLLPERTVSYSLQSLVSKNILLKTTGGGRGNPSKWTFNKDWEKWKIVQLIAPFKVGEINSAIKNTVLNCRQTVQPIAPFAAIDCTLYPSKSLIPLAPESPKAINKERKAIRASKEAPVDLRITPLKKFISEEFKSCRGCKLITDNSDWNKFAALMKSTRDDPDFSVENLERAWSRFLNSQDDFHRKQGHPLRYWSSNINAFIASKNGGRPNATSNLNFDGHPDETPGSTSERRTSCGDPIYVPKQ